MRRLSALALPCLLLAPSLGCNEASTSRLLAVPDSGLAAAPADAADAGFVDSNIPAPFDAGIPEIGGPDDTGPRCRSTAAGDCYCSATTARGGPYLRDDCPDPADVCVPWDQVAGRPDTPPLSVCARPCQSNADCGRGEQCASVGLPQGSGAERVCVDDVAAADEYCSGTRLTRREAVTRELEVKVPGQRAGCRDGLECVLGADAEAHIDEGVCLARCETDADCPRELPFCNPDLLPINSDPTGVCSPQRLGRGTVCGPQQPQQVGYIYQCDTQSRAVCVQVQGLLSERQGFCMTPCTGDAECPTGEGPDTRCTQFGGGFGLCTDGCSNYPDDCQGPGADGLGRTCMDYLADEFGNQVGFCMDRRPPTLRPARIDEDGDIEDPGDNCFPASFSEAFLRCPEPAACVIVDFNQNVGVCVHGCDSDANNGDATCEAILGAGSTCIDVDGGGPFGAAGFCTTP